MSKQKQGGGKALRPAKKPNSEPVQKVALSPARRKKTGLKNNKNNSPPKGYIGSVEGSSGYCVARCRQCPSCLVARGNEENRARISDYRSWR